MQECSNTLTEISTKTTAEALLNKMPNNYACTDKRRHTVRWLNSETGNIEVDSKCRLLGQHIYSVSAVQAVCQQIKDLLQKFEQQTSVNCQNPDLLSYKVMESLVNFGAHLKQVLHGLKSADWNNKQPIHEHLASLVSHHFYKSIKDDVSSSQVTIVHTSFKTLVDMITNYISSTLTSLESVVLRSPEYLGGVISNIIHVYTRQHNLPSPQYNIHDNIDMCMISLADDNKVLQTFKAIDLFDAVADFLYESKSTIELIQKVKFEYVVHEMKEQVHTNYNRMIAFADKTEPTTAYTQAMFAVMHSDCCSD